MWLPRVRLTVRRLMVAVAVVAVGLAGCLGVVRARARRQYLVARQLYLKQADLHDLRASTYLAHAKSFATTGAQFQKYAEEFRATDQGRSRFWEAEADRSTVKEAAMKHHAAHHARMRQKWRQAYLRPWLPVAPDPAIQESWPAPTFAEMEFRRSAAALRSQVAAVGVSGFSPGLLVATAIDTTPLSRVALIGLATGCVPMLVWGAFRLKKALCPGQLRPHASFAIDPVNGERRLRGAARH